MKRLDFGQTVSVVANLGVIAGIVFLGVELSQNNELMRAQSEYNYLQVRMGSRQGIIEDRDIAAFWASRRANEPLDEIDRLRLHTHIEATILVWQWEFGQLVDGNRPETRSDVAARWRSSVTQAGGFSGSGFVTNFPEVWTSFKFNLRNDFVDFVESEVLVE